MKNTLKNASQRMIWGIIFLSLMFSMAQISMVSAAANTKEFSRTADQRYGTITISSGTTALPLADITLTDNTDNCLTHCYAEGTITLHESGKLMDSMRFKKLMGLSWNPSSIKNYKAFVSTRTGTKTVSDYKIVCNEIDSGNGNMTQLCENRKIGSHIETYPIWDSYDNSVLSAGTYKWRIEGQKNQYESFDWIGTWKGVEVTEWAAWNASMDNQLKLYYDFESDTERVSGHYNLVPGQGQIIYNQTDCLIGSCGHFATNKNANITANPYINLGRAENMSFNFWVRTENGGKVSNPIVIQRVKNDLTADEGTIQIGGSNSQNISFESLHYVGVANRKALELNWTWYMITYVKNSTGWGKVYVNGTLQGEGQSSGWTDNDAYFFLLGRYRTEIANMTGQMDEMGWWNRTLSQNEITDLYNDGAGLPYIKALSWTLGVYENSQTYNPSTFIGNAELFKINITYNSSMYPNFIGTLYYNNSAYIGTQSGSGDNVLFSASLKTPVVGTQNNITFYWGFQLVNASGFIDFVNSTFHNQTINTLAMDDCTTNSVLILNYTTRDERTQAIIDNATYNTTIEINAQIYALNTSTLIINYSKVFSPAYNARVCIGSSLLNTSQYSLYATARYYADSYVSRYNYVDNYYLTNATRFQNINLYDLQTAYAYQFFITYKNKVFLAVPNAIISILRNYPGENTYKTVEMTKTDSNGQAAAFFDLSGVAYSAVVTQNGSTLSIFPSIPVVCTNKLSGECSMNLFDTASFTPAINPYYYNNVNYYVSFNQTTRILFASFNTVDGTTGLFNLTAFIFSPYLNTTLCSNSIVTSSGSLSCNIASSAGNVTFYSLLSKDGTVINEAVWSISVKSSGPFYGNIVFLSLGLLITIPFMLLPSLVGLIMGIIIGMILMSVLLFANGSTLLGASSSLIWIIIVAGIIIWKASKGGTD